MTAFGVEKLISYEESFYPKRRTARSYSSKGREQLAACYMEAFEGIEDRDVLNAYIKMVRGGHPMPTVAQIIDAAGWADKVETDRPAKLVGSSDIQRMTTKIPTWKTMMLADEQDGREVKPEAWYMEKYGV